MGAGAKLIGGPAVVFGAIVGLAALTAPDDAGGARPARAAATPAYAHEVLQRDADMTGQMSAPTANTSAQVHREDGQLVRTRSGDYLRALEQHQAGLDQMLARPAP